MKRGDCRRARGDAGKGPEVCCCSGPGGIGALGCIPPAEVFLSACKSGNIGAEGERSGGERIGGGPAGGIVGVIDLAIIEGDDVGIGAAVGYGERSIELCRGGGNVGD